MNLYLVRHTHAVAEEEDASRPLSLKGREQARRLGRHLSGLGCITAETLFHSSLLRSLETASLLAGELGLPKSSLRLLDGLLPEDDPRGVADLLQRHQDGDIALVGHEPMLGRLATLLVRGREEPIAFDIAKGSVLLLRPASGAHRRSGFSRWELRWMLSKELLPGAGGRR